MIDGCHIDGRSRVGYTERNEFLDEKLRMETMDLARGVAKRDRARTRFTIPSHAAYACNREISVTLTDQLLAAFSQYGLPLMFGVITIASAGVPLPITLMLVAAGSFVALGEMKFWQVVVVASAAAVLGDQIGYALGRWGGHRVAGRVNRKKARAAQMRRAEKFARRWGGAGIFFSRWLVTPLGPWINLSSGMAAYPWARFLCWDIVGEVLWV